MEDKIRELMRKAFREPYQAKHVVLLLWLSPLDRSILEHRSAAFEEYTDAFLYAEYLSERYLAMNVMFSVYLDGELHKKKGVFVV